jgi:predicted nucleic acid-binding protein
VIDGASVLAAIDLQGLEKISFWDALIVAAAQKAGTKVLLSEDLADGRVFADVTVRNPFIKNGDA